MGKMSQEDSRRFLDLEDMQNQEAFEDEVNLFTQGFILGIMLMQEIAAQKRLWSMALRFIRNGKTRLYDAENLFQTCFLALVDAVSGFNPAHGTFLTYLNYLVRKHFHEVAGIRSTKQRPDKSSSFQPKNIDKPQMP